MAAGLVMSWSRGASWGPRRAPGCAAGHGPPRLAGTGRGGTPRHARSGVHAVRRAHRTRERLTEALDYIGAPDVTAIEVTDANFANLERLAHWRAAWRMFERAPWLGVGTGQYAAVYPTVAVPRWEDPLGHAHNILLNVMAEGGLLALAAYLGLMAAAVWTTWRAARVPTACSAVTLGSLGMMATCWPTIWSTICTCTRCTCSSPCCSMVLAQQRRAGLVMNRSKRGTP